MMMVVIINAFDDNHNHWTVHMKVTKAQAAQNRQDILEAAARCTASTGWTASAWPR